MTWAWQENIDRLYIYTTRLRDTNPSILPGCRQILPAMLPGRVVETRFRLKGIFVWPKSYHVTSKCIISFYKKCSRIQCFCQGMLTTEEKGRNFILFRSFAPSFYSQSIHLAIGAGDIGSWCKTTRVPSNHIISWHPRPWPWATGVSKDGLLLTILWKQVTCFKGLSS